MYTAKLMALWSLMTAALIAAFWFVFMAMSGHVPLALNIWPLGKDWTVVLPFSLSQFWDALIGIIFSVTALGVYDRIKGPNKKSVGGAMLMCMAGSLAFGVFMCGCFGGFMDSFHYLLPCGFMGLFVSTIVGVNFALDQKSYYTGLGAGVLSYLSFILPLSLYLGLPIFMFFVLVFAVYAGIITIFYHAVKFSCGLKPVETKISEV